MYKRILIPTDGSEVAQKGVDQGLSLARSLGAKVTIITVTEPFPYYPSVDGAGVAIVQANLPDYAESQRKSAEEILAKAGEGAKKLGVAAQVRYVPDARPAEAILEAARTLDCDLIVMASHGRRGLNRLLLGSQTAEVLAASPVPVLVVR
jgi:nucleotide-binding universal stress UspA family protein